MFVPVCLPLGHSHHRWSNMWVVPFKTISYLKSNFFEFVLASCLFICGHFHERHLLFSHFVYNYVVYVDVWSTFILSRVISFPATGLLILWWWRNPYATVTLQLCLIWNQMKLPWVNSMEHFKTRRACLSVSNIHKRGYVLSAPG